MMGRVVLTFTLVLLLVTAADAQRTDKELVATISGPALGNGIVSELAWEGGVLIIQSVAMEPTGRLSPRYFTVPGPGMDVRPMPTAPAGLARYWQMKSNRVSPTGLGRITTTNDSKLPMYGVGTLEQRMLDAEAFGGTVVTHDLRINDLVFHTRRSGEPPYDGEVWSWSPAELNRIAYVDGKGDLWIARADGRNAERLLRGTYTLPAWSEDGRMLAIAERKDSGRKWEVSVVHLAERFRS
jgi:hypothetical protein